jgi:HSP20 family molecular chaperone IbpA
MENYNLILGISTALFIGLLSILIWSFVTDNGKSKSEVVEDPQMGSDDDLDSEQTQSELLDNMMRDQSKDILSGKTDRYDWKQTETDVEMTLPIPPSISKRDVKVEVKSRHITLTISGVERVKGEFYAEIVPSEFTWHFEGEGENRRIELIFEKKISTERNQHWKCVLKGDEQIGKT